MDPEIFMSSEPLSQLWKRIYDENAFSFEVRYHLHDWLKDRPWEDIKDNDEHCKDMYCNLMDRLQGKIMEKHENKLEWLQLKSAKAKLQENFEARPSDLVDVLCKCLSSERLLAESAKPDEERSPTQEDEQILEYRQREQKIRQAVLNLNRHSQSLEVKIEQFHDFMESTVACIKDFQDASKKPHKKQDQLKQLEKDASQRSDEMPGKIQELVNELARQCQNVSSVMKESWDLIHLYKQQQKDLVCFRPKPPDGAVDCLNKVCEESSQQLKAYLVHVEKVRADLSCISFPTRNPCKDHLEQLSKFMSDHLHRHLDEIFVITKQPQNVLKIVQNKSPTISMCVRLLGGRGLGIEHNLPTVKVNVYAEQNLHEALVAPGLEVQGVCTNVENGTQLMELKRCSGHIQANLNNVRLRGVERLEKKMKEDRVTQQKYGMIFYTCVTVNNERYNLKTLTLPVILTSQTSQDGAAKGTLVWDAAFSIPDRQLYEDKKKVLWREMEHVLRGMFSETGRDLDQAQLNHIARYIFTNGQMQLGGVEDFSEHELTKERFMTDKVPGRDFTIWKWLYACKNLVQDYVRTEWQDNMIHGFIGRQEAEELLQGKSPGTFLLRFRERKLEVSQRASKCAYLALAVVAKDITTGQCRVDHVKDHLTPTDIHKYTLTRLLNSMVDVHTKGPLLHTLYPDRSFQEIVQRHLPNESDTSSGYKPTRLLIQVDRDIIGANSPMAPESPASFVMSPGCATPPDIDFDNIAADPAFGDVEILMSMQQALLLNSKEDEPAGEIRAMSASCGATLAITKRKGVLPPLAHPSAPHPAAMDRNGNAMIPMTVSELQDHSSETSPNNVYTVTRPTK